MAVNEVRISGIAIFGSSETKQSSSMFVSMVDACHSWRECEGENVTRRIRGCTCRKGNDMTLSLQQSDPSKSMACLPLSLKRQDLYQKSKEKTARQLKQHTCPAQNSAFWIFRLKLAPFIEKMQKKKERGDGQTGFFFLFLKEMYLSCYSFWRKVSHFERKKERTPNLRKGVRKVMVICQAV